MRFTAPVLLVGLVAAGCGQADPRPAQQQECRQAGGVYHQGEDWDDDVCVISREKVIIFDNREPKQ